MVAELAAIRPVVTGAIRDAARATGANFQYLLATAKVESNLDPNAAVRTSSARGLFQFIEQTWLATLKESGPALGYGQFAQAIERTPDGQYVVRDQRLQTRILNLRSDPTANAVMAGAHTRDNAVQLRSALGRKPSEGELYIAHFLGASGAGRLIGTASQAPHARAADLFPSAARANPSIFYDRKGQARSAGQVYSTLVGRYEQARGRAGSQPSGTASAVAQVPFQQVPLPQQRMGYAPKPAAVAASAQTYAAAAQLAEQRQINEPPLAALGDNGPAFHGLFSTPGGRREPLSSAVRTLWGVPSVTNAPMPGPMPISRTDQGHPKPIPDAPASAAAPASDTQPLFEGSQPDVRALFRGRV